MQRFRLLFLAFAVALLALAALLVDRALHSVAIERQMRHQALAERIFDEMERGLTRLLEREEQRPFEHYVPEGPRSEGEAAAFPFVIGYFQVDPDGSVHTQPVLRAEQGGASALSLQMEPQAQPGVASEIERIVRAQARAAGNRPRTLGPAAAQMPGTTLPLGPDAGLAPSVAAPAPAQRAPQEVSAFDALRSLNKGVQERAERQQDVMGPTAEEAYAPLTSTSPTDLVDAARSEIASPRMSGRVIDNQHLLVARTVVHDGQAYRQGMLVDVQQLGAWLREQGLGSDTDGLAAYTDVSFVTPFSPAPAAVSGPEFLYQHRFAEPFVDLTARLALRPLPGLGSVAYVYALCALLPATAVLGLAALYRMVSVVVSFAERRNNFVAAVSHELKTPLTAIRMYGEMLRDGMVPSDAKRQEYYCHITAESERLSRLINNVLEFSRLEKGTREMALVVGSIAPVVQEVTGLLRPHVQAQGFELDVEVGADLPPVRFERDALMQVLWNLVDNALKYARGASPRRIVVCCRRDGVGVHVAVRDHGPGVPSRHLNKIFEPFYRGESELTRRNKGTGLGLALVRGLAERMGARVSGGNVGDGGFEVDIVFRPVPA